MEENLWKKPCLQEKKKKLRKNAVILNISLKPNLWKKNNKWLPSIHFANNGTIFVIFILFYNQSQQ